MQQANELFWVAGTSLNWLTPSPSSPPSITVNLLQYLAISVLHLVQWERGSRSKYNTNKSFSRDELKYVISSYVTVCRHPLVPRLLCRRTVHHRTSVDATHFRLRILRRSTSFTASCVDAPPSPPTVSTHLCRRRQCPRTSVDAHYVDAPCLRRLQPAPPAPPTHTVADTTSVTALCVYTLPSSPPW
jgi:hypothetical protein